MGQWVFPTTRWAIYLRDDLSCVYCGVTIQAILKGDGDNFLTLDHLHSKVKGGGNEPANLVTACYACNCAKGQWSLARACRELGWGYSALKSRIAARRMRDIERYRPAAKLLLGRVEGVPMAEMVYDHDWMVKRQWGDSLDGQYWEHLRQQGRLWCEQCHAPINQHTGRWTGELPDPPPPPPPPPGNWWGEGDDPPF